jgi:photosystem II stability/assembly factor-like uncharacterized protein
VSQLGSADFHKLQASGVRVWALAADGAVWRSVDAGRSWQVADTPPMGDIAVDPNDSERLVALTRTSVMLSRDAGANFGAWTGAPALTFVAWTTDGVYGVTPSGNIVRADGLGRPWQRRGTVPKDIQSIASNGADLVLATGRSLLTSRDGGRTFVMSARLR